MQISDKMKNEGKEAEVINARFLKPLDKEKILDSIKKTKFVVTIEDGTILGGLGSSVKELLVDEKIKDIKIKTFAYPDKFIQHGSVNELENLYGMDWTSIVNYIRQEINEKG